MMELYFVVVPFLIYLMLIASFTIGWMMIPKQDQPGSIPVTRLTLIIPFRNEESTILSCLEDIIQQDYPAHLMEVYLADDHSDDNSPPLVLDFIANHPGFSLHYLKVDGNTGRANKKLAIEQVMMRSSGELIIMTDADTRFSKSRIRIIEDYYEKTHAKMILGPVEFIHEKTFFSRIQSLEFTGLMGATAGSCGTGYPIMCNGANLAFGRTAFNAVDGFSDNKGFSSGDDLFLLLRIRKKFGRKSVVYVKSKDAVVSTNPQNTLHDFLQQRVRWVSKSKGYKDGWILFVALITYLANLSLAGLLIYGIFDHPVFWFTLILFCLKMVIEFPLVYMTCRFYGKLPLLRYYPFVQVMNIFYVVFVGFIGNFLSYEWKGRRLRT